jgi:4-aminobutyrate aminotransferase-like enzyme
LSIYSFLPGTDWLAKSSGIVFKKGKGVYLEDSEHKQYVDFSSGNMSVPFGHANDFITGQLLRVMNKPWNIQDFMTEDKIIAFNKIKKFLPTWIEGITFHTGGTEAIESMMRAIISYTKRYTFIAYQKGFHGYTLGSRSLGPSILKGYGPLWGNVIYVPPADCSNCPVKQKKSTCNIECFSLFKESVENQGSEKPAAFLFEPILGAAGIIVPPVEYYKKVTEYCRENQIIIACDEILTGLWRTGSRFAFEDYGFIPDIIAFSKGLGNGFPVMCVGGRKEIMFSHPYSYDGWNTTTFSGNTLSWVAAGSTLEYASLQIENLKLKEKEQILQTFFQNLKSKFPALKVRGKGMAWCLDFTNFKFPHEIGQKFATLLLKEANIRVNDSFHFVRLMPPLIISEELLEENLEKIKNILKKLLMEERGIKKNVEN